MHKAEEILNDLEIEFSTELDKAITNLKDTLSLDQSKLEFNNVKVKYFSKNSGLFAILKDLKNIPDINERKKIGEKANKLRVKLTEKLSSSEKAFTLKILESQLKTEKIDPTRPGIKVSINPHQHLISSTIGRIEDIFTSMGFKVRNSFEVDNEYNNFDALNIAANHPARDNWDTLWLSDGNLMVTHTSSMQNRILAQDSSLIKEIIIGKCFRNEATDARHEHTFHQLEGVYLAKKATMGDMLGVLLEFFEKYFERKLKYKFTPDFFPFVEPGAMLSIECVICDGKGCKVCKLSGYLEVLGCGMIHPKVIANAGKNPKEYSGFAWGIGIERLALLNNDINDIRYFYSNDLRFINQFN